MRSNPKRSLSEVVKKHDVWFEHRWIPIHPDRINPPSASFTHHRPKAATNIDHLVDTEFASQVVEDCEIKD
jgi:hypothetical protein